MPVLTRLAHQALLRLDPETAHRLALRALAAGVRPRLKAAHDPLVATAAFGRSLASPIGLAAGFDKNAEAPDALLASGFGFVEVGTVTPRPQAGNPPPRLFRLKGDAALVNRLGFNNDGLEAVVARLSARRGRPGLVGVNVGANRDSEDRIADYVTGYRAVAPHAGYVTVNVSSPNTPGLRNLQTGEALEALLAALTAERAAGGGSAGGPPIVLKVAPDLLDDEIAEIAGAVGRHRIDGLIVGNTTIDRPPHLVSPAAAEAGGLSGRPLFQRSTVVLARFARLIAPDVVLIGAGGVSDGETAFQKIAAGAHLVQLYTGLVYGGPRLMARIHHRLARAVAVRGFASLAEAVGCQTEEWAAVALLPVAEDLA